MIYLLDICFDTLCYLSSGRHMFFRFFMCCGFTHYGVVELWCSTYYVLAHDNTLCVL